LSNKEQKIQDLEKALADQKETSERNISEMLDKLRLLFGEYEKSLKNFGVRPAPLPANLGISDFMEWIDAEFKAHSLKLSLVQVTLLLYSLLKAY
jgi:hypothetical protein